MDLTGGIVAVEDEFAPPITDGGVDDEEGEPDDNDIAQKSGGSSTGIRELVR